MKRNPGLVDSHRLLLVIPIVVLLISIHSFSGEKILQDSGHFISPHEEHIEANDAVPATFIPGEHFSANQNYSDSIIKKNQKSNEGYKNSFGDIKILRSSGWILFSSKTLTDHKRNTQFLLCVLRL